jgi:hypothetical protein
LVYKGSSQKVECCENKKKKVRTLGKEYGVGRGHVGNIIRTD